jgi:hypothetical protein
MGRPIGHVLPDLAAASRQLPRTAGLASHSIQREKPPCLAVAGGVVARIETLAINNPRM